MWPNMIILSYIAYILISQHTWKSNAFTSIRRLVLDFSIFVSVIKQTSVRDRNKRTEDPCQVRYTYWGSSNWKQIHQTTSNHFIHISSLRTNVYMKDYIYWIHKSLLNSFRISFHQLLLFLFLNFRLYTFHSNIITPLRYCNSNFNKCFPSYIFI